MQLTSIQLLNKTKFPWLYKAIQGLQIFGNYLVSVDEKDYFQNKPAVLRFGLKLRMAREDALSPPLGTGHQAHPGPAQGMSHASSRPEAAPETQLQWECVNLDVCRQLSANYRHRI